VLKFGRQSDDLAARLAAVVVHVYTPPLPVVDSARKLPALSPTMEVGREAIPSCIRVHVFSFKDPDSSARAAGAFGGCYVWGSANQARYVAGRPSWFEQHWRTRSLR